ncbi:hypothetical protein BH09PAT1_BH09PAT1_8130 [soil metagenome]
MATSTVFQNWLKVEAARLLGKSNSDSEIKKVEEVIRSYNFKENRVTNHKTGEKKNNLREFLDGGI